MNEVVHSIANQYANKVENLIAEVKKLPALVPEERHYFGPNIYIKELVMPKGAVVIGKPHKTHHLCNMLSGHMIIVNPDGSRKELKAPMTFMAPPGRKVAYILETVVFQNIFSTDETDVEKLESMFIETPLLEEK